MNRIFVSFFALFLGLSMSLAAFDAEARRMGGGKSFGMQRSAPAKREASPQQQQGTQPAATPQKRSWMGPIAGLAAGLGLAALMSHLGLGAEFANMLLIALAVMAAFMLFRYLTRNKNAPAMQYAGPNPSSLNAPNTIDSNASRFDSSRLVGSSSTAAYANDLPPGFDEQTFVREAKLNFIRMQLSERGDVTQETDVVNLNAEVLECAEENSQLIASVRFHGLMNEDATGTLPFDETWHLTKSANGRGGWVVAGIQQN